MQRDVTFWRKKLKANNEAPRFARRLKNTKAYPEKIQNIPLSRKKSNISSDSLFLQQLAVIVEELSSKVLQCTQTEFLRILPVHNAKVLPGSSDVF